MSRVQEVFGDWRPRAVVFDCDGLLLDTECVWERTQSAVLDRHGATLPPEAQEAMVGSTLEVAAEHIARAAGAGVEEMTAEVREHFTAALETDLQVMPGARAVVEAAAARVPIAVASNSWHEMLERKLVRTGLLDLFTAVESADTVEHGKPAPDMYQQAAAALGARPIEALAFEDSTTGARAALAAGLRLITVPPPGTRIPTGDLRLDSLDDPELLTWIETWPVRTAPPAGVDPAA